MLTTNEILKILNNNKNNKKYTEGEAHKIKLLLYQLGEMAYLQFKQINANEKSNLIRTGIYRQAS
jgi:hypothetical protein